GFRGFFFSSFSFLFFCVSSALKSTHPDLGFTHEEEPTVGRVQTGKSLCFFAFPGCRQLLSAVGGPPYRRRRRADRGSAPENKEASGENEIFEGFLRFYRLKGKRVILPVKFYRFSPRFSEVFQKQTSD
ncbi:hypothetical protein QML37_31010, partial [Klebsiella pneumoniae]|uniref:hypothetical protein n=1 Tax=Klebsiella pneumoniae TaxID=573 RepID=UPI003A8119D9